MDVRRAALEKVSDAARAVDREGGDLPHLNDELSAALAAVTTAETTGGGER